MLPGCRVLPGRCRGAAGCCRVAGYLDAHPHSWSGLSGCRVAGCCRVAGYCRVLPGTAGLPGCCRGVAGDPGSCRVVAGLGCRVAGARAQTNTHTECVVCVRDHTPRVTPACATPQTETPSLGVGHALTGRAGTAVSFSRISDISRSTHAARARARATPACESELVNVRNECIGRDWSSKSTPLMIRQLPSHSHTAGTRACPRTSPDPRRL